MNKEDIIKLPYSRIIPLGYKPEDYFIVKKEFPIKIARLIVKEINFIEKQNSQEKNLI
jgi:hypothetical protein